MNINTQYNLIGADYLAGQKKFYTKRKDKAREYIKKSIGSLKGKKVLDIGCGAGSDILIYEKLGAKEVYGIDASSFMLNEARKKVLKPNNLFVSSAEKLPLSNNSIDIVAGRFSLHYLKFLKKSYQETARVLKKNGLMVLVLPHPFIDVMRQEKKNYGLKQKAPAELYNGQVVVTYYSHTFSDYFSSEFFKLFELKDIFEYDEDEPPINGIKVPSGFGFVAYKK